MYSVCVSAHVCVRACVWKAGPGTAGLGELQAELKVVAGLTLTDAGDCAWGFAPRHPEVWVPGPRQHQAYGESCRVRAGE